MTFFYGSNWIGMTNQLLEDDEYKDLEFRASSYIGKKLYHAVRELLPRCAEARDFLQELAKVAASKNKSIQWRTPDGLPVFNQYPKPKTKIVNSWMHERGVSIPERVQTMVATGYEKDLRRKKSRDSVTANFVHSMDGCLLRRVAVTAAPAGIQLATVHDCFACLPSNADRLRAILLDEFATMYEETDILGSVLGRPIAYGNFKPSDIREAQSAFG